MANTFIGVLRSKNFLRLWVGQVTSQLAFNIVNFVIVLHIYELTGSSTSVSLVLIASALPSVLFGALSGVVADRFDYKKILVSTALLRFLAVIFLIFSKNNVLGLLEVVFLISTVAQFFAPAESATIPLVVNEKKLVSANSVAVTTTYATMLLGYSLAGPLMSLITVKGTLLLTAALYLLAAYSIISMRNYDFKKVKKVTLSNLAHVIEQIWSQTKDGIIHLKDSNDIYLPMLKLSLGWVVLGSFVVLIQAFAQDEMHLSTKLVGVLLIAPAGFGMLLGANYLNKRKRFSFNRMANGGFIFAGLSLLLFSMYRFYYGWIISLPLAVLLMILMGAFCSIVYIASQTMLQISCNGEMRGRIFGISSMFTNLAMSIPAILVGGISDLTSPFVMLIVLSIANIIYGIYSNQKEAKTPMYVGKNYG